MMAMKYLLYLPILCRENAICLPQLMYMILAIYLRKVFFYTVNGFLCMDNLLNFFCQRSFILLQSQEMWPQWNKPRCLLHLIIIYRATAICIPAMLYKILTLHQMKVTISIIVAFMYNRY